MNVTGYASPRTDILSNQEIKIFECLLIGRFQWPSGLRRGSAAACLLGLRVRIPPGAWMFVCCVVFVR